MTDADTKNKLAVEEALRKYTKQAANIQQALLCETSPLHYREWLFSILKYWTAVLRDVCSIYYPVDTLPKFIHDDYQSWLASQQRRDDCAPAKA